MIKDLFLGLTYNVKAFSFIKQHASLQKYIWLPLFLNLVLFVFALFYGIQLLHPFVADLLANFYHAPASDSLTLWQEVVQFFFGALRWIMEGVLFFVFLLLLFFFMLLLSGFINAPFYERLTIHTLALCGGDAMQNLSWREFFVEWFAALRLEVLKFVVFIVPMLVLFLLSWLPGLGIFFSIITLVFLAWYFGFAQVVYPGFFSHADFFATLSFARRHKALLCGFGAFTLIPLLGCLLTGIQVVGGVLLYVDHQKK